MVADGDKVAIRATAYGVHNTDRLAEHWGVRDELTVLQQVGAIPTPPPPAVAAHSGASPR